MRTVKFYSLQYNHGDWADHHKGLRDYIKLLDKKAFCVSDVLTDSGGCIYFEIRHLTVSNIMEIPNILGEQLIIDGDIVLIYDNYIE